MRRIGYTDLDALYNPGFIHVAGNDNGNGNGRMLGGILASLFGKSQAWFSNVSRIQKELVILQGEVSAFGKEVWDAVASSSAGKATIFVDSAFTGYDYTMEWALNHQKAILVTQNYEPSDAVIASADLYSRRVRAMVEFAKKVVPEMAAQVAADRAKIEANLVGSGLKSPAEAGEAAFIQSIEDQTKSLGFGLAGIGLAAAALAAIYLFGGSRRQSNPGFFSGKIFGIPTPLVIAGGAYGVWQLSKKAS